MNIASDNDCLDLIASTLCEEDGVDLDDVEAKKWALKVFEGMSAPIEP